MPDLRVARPDTIRTRLEAIRDRHVGTERRWGMWCCNCCENVWPCPDYVDAVAALDLLDNAAIVNPALSMKRGRERVVPDPERYAK